MIRAFKLVQFSEVKYEYKSLLSHLWPHHCTSLCSNEFNIKLIKGFVMYYF